MKKPIGIGLVIGLLALAFAALPAMASATVTLHEETATGKKLPAGTAVAGSSTDLKFVTGAGKIHCNENTVGGKIESYGTESVTLEVTTATFAKGGAVGTRCESEIKAEGNPTEAVVTGQEFPWIIHLYEDGTSTITGVQFNIGLFISGTNIQVASCTYAGELEDEWEIGVAPLPDTIQPQSVPLVSGTGCPPSGEVSGTFTVTSGGKAVVGTVP